MWGCAWSIVGVVRRWGRGGSGAASRKGGAMMRERDRIERAATGRREDFKLEPARAGASAEMISRAASGGRSEAWESASPILRSRFGESNFARWIDPLAVRFDTTGLSLLAADLAGTHALRQHFLPGIVEALRQVGYGGPVRLAAAPRAASGSAAGQPATPDPTPDPPAPGTVPTAVAESRTGPGADEGEEPFPLNPRYTFDGFVIGDSNRFAYEAARLAAESPGRSHNPLYLHGGVGRGKTHLATAAARVVRERRGASAALAVSADRFFALCDSVDRGRDDRLDPALRGASLVIFDDVQLLTRDDGVLDAFFRVFDELLGAGCQLILTCDVPPPAIPSLAMRLNTRWETGLASEIRAPDFALRREIVRRKAARSGDVVGEEVIEFIAASEDGSVRALEGAFHRAREFAAATSRELSLVVARQALEIPRPARRSGPPSLDEIAAAVAEAFGLTVRALRSRRRRDREASLARQVAVHVARRLSGRSLVEIALDLGYREHSVAAHASATARARLESDPELASRVQRIERRLAGPESEGRLVANR